MTRMTAAEHANYQHGQKRGRISKGMAAAIAEGVITIRIPLHTVSLMNSREHWAKKARRAREHRSTAALWTQYLPHLGFPLTVTLTRISARALDDDNLRGALKSVRDGVADRLGIDDRDPRVKWEYAQEKGFVGEKAVEVKAVRT